MLQSRMNCVFVLGRQKTDVGRFRNDDNIKLRCTGVINTLQVYTSMSYGPTGNIYHTLTCEYRMHEIWRTQS